MVPLVVEGRGTGFELQGQFQREQAMRCQSCELARINGVICHETGCPNAHRFSLRECRWCGTEFAPEHPRQWECDESCHRSYCGLPDEDSWTEQDQLDLEEQTAE